jgi:hypothetical protein
MQQDFLQLVEEADLQSEGQESTKGSVKSGCANESKERAAPNLTLLVLSVASLASLKRATAASSALAIGLWRRLQLAQLIMLPVRRRRGWARHAS